MSAGRPAPDDGGWDVAIVGGGPAGAATALALRRLCDLTVCIVEPGQRQPFAVGESIPPDARLDLDRLGVWDRFTADAQLPCLGSCSAWGSDTLGHNDFLLNPYGPGWHLDRARLNRMLLDQAVARGATLIGGSRFAGRLRASGRDHVLSLRGRRDGTTATINARFAVDATGHAAAFARTMGAVRATHDRLTVVCGFFNAAAASLSRLTLLEAERDGWWYAAAIPDDRVIVAFATDASTVRQASLARPEAWLARCLATRHVAGRLDGCRFISGSLTIRMASSSILRPAAGLNWFAVGDSAASYDPISAAGIQKALADGSRAASAILAAAGGPAAAAAAAAEYANDTETAFSEYEENRGYFYKLENRWPDSPFWIRRNLAPAHCLLRLTTCRRPSRLQNRAHAVRSSSDTASAAAATAATAAVATAAVECRGSRRGA
jgi:flavin-dependent dehydrogenase